MHNYNANTYLLPRKLALPSPWEGQGRLRKLAPPSLGGVGGGYAS